jgi:hypothetical protein
MRRILPAMRTLIFALLIVNVLAIGAEAFIRFKMNRSSGPLARGSAFPPLAGVAKSGLFRPEGPQAARNCHVVRFASRQCPACAPAQSQGYVLLVDALAARGCDVTILSPHGSDLPIADQGLPRQEMRAVSLSFVAASGFTATPTTVVFDRNWKVLWSAVGAFHEDIARTALRTIP